MMRAVIFDMDGVIFDSEKLVLDAWEYVGGKHRFEVDRQTFIECIGTTKEKTKEIICNHYGDTFAYDAYSKETSHFFHEYVREHGLPVKRGVRELLCYLKEEGIPVGLASSTRLAVVEEELKLAGLYDYFRVLVGGDQLKRSKPAPDIYLLACEKAAVLPEQAFAVEDSYNGIRAAYSAGMSPLMVPDIIQPDDEMREKSTAIFDDLLQVMEYFKEKVCFTKEGCGNDGKS